MRFRGRPGRDGPHTSLFLKRLSRGNIRFILSRIEEHSKKPEEARRRIEALMGDVPRVELFARRPASGWDVWGNEVDSTID